MAVHRVTLPSNEYASHILSSSAAKKLTVHQAHRRLQSVRAAGTGSGPGDVLYRAAACTVCALRVVSIPPRWTLQSVQ